MRQPIKYQKEITDNKKKIKTNQITGLYFNAYNVHILVQYDDSKQ